MSSQLVTAASRDRRPSVIEDSSPAAGGLDPRPISRLFQIGVVAEAIQAPPGQGWPVAGLCVAVKPSCVLSFRVLGRESAGVDADDLPVPESLHPRFPVLAAGPGVRCDTDPTWHDGISP